MKTKLSKFGLTLLICSSSFFSNAQAVNQGEIITDIYSGGPNLYTSVLEAIYINSGNEEDIVFGGIPIIGGRFSYMATDKISIGAELNYTTTTIDYRTNNYTYNITVPRIRAMLRFELHFGQSDQFDFYWPIAAGYNSTRYNFTTNDPNYKEETVKSLIPLAFRTGLGGRYFITPNIGLNLELGLGGGPIIEGGLAIKF